ncbi:MAG: hypothetical protein Aurels2KO_13180 [Aureliella sp.]
MNVTKSRFLGGMLALTAASTSLAQPADSYTRTIVPTAVSTSPSDAPAPEAQESQPEIASGIGPGACDLACDGGSCDGGSIFGGQDKGGLLGLGIVKPSDHCFDDFISPMTNPVFFEDPRTLSEVRFIFINHELPAALGGNSVQVYAMQVRAALTERLSLIATKDGLIYTQSPVLDSGYADVAAGLKYNLYRDACAGRLLSTGFTYEIPMGSNRSLQGNGNGEFHFFVTGGTRIGKKSHWISASGLREPNDTNLENRIWYWSNHLDRQIGDRPLYAFTEVNWYNYLSSGNGPGSIEGGDLFNLGAAGVTGNDLVTQAIGLKARPRRNIEAGIAYEYPLTARQGLLEDRLTADLIFRF